MSHDLTPPPSIQKEFTEDWRNWLYRLHQSIKNWGIHGDRNNSVSITISDVESLEVDNDATAGNTRFLIYDVDNATLERVSVGAADSGGVGYKVLRIPN